MVDLVAMADSKYQQILFIGPSGRQRENLFALIESLAVGVAVQSFDTCKQAEKLILTEVPTLILIDDRHGGEERGAEITRIMHNRPWLAVVILKSRPARTSVSAQRRVSELVYNEISVGVLQRILFESGP
jgi:hypothetical protein